MTNRERVKNIRIGAGIFEESIYVGFVKNNGYEWVEKREFTDKELLEIVLIGIAKLSKIGSTQIINKNFGTATFSFVPVATTPPPTPNGGTKEAAI